MGLPKQIQNHYEYEEIARFMQSMHGQHAILTFNEGQEAPKTFFSDNLLDQWSKAEGRNNVYFSVNSFRWGNSRKSERVFELTNFYVDLDLEKIGIPVRFGLHMLTAMLDEKNLPQPSLIINSGHGLHVYWRIEPVMVNAPKIWRTHGHIQVELCERLAELGADQACTDVSRILRIPGTFNVKKGHARKRVEVVHFEPKNIYDMEMFQKELLPELEKKQAKPKRLAPKEITTPKKAMPRIATAYMLQKDRISDLMTLAELRSGQRDGFRELMLWMCTKFHKQSNGAIPQSEIYRLNSLFREPLSDREVEKVYRNTNDMNMTNAYMVRVLDITAEEQRYMKTIIGETEKKKRKKARNVRNYAPTREKNQQTKSERDEAILRMKSEGYTHAQIAEKLQITTKTVQRTLKRMEKSPV